VRLGVIPEGIIDRIALASGKGPIPLLETLLNALNDFGYLRGDHP
jgi:hypothetical protein